MYWFTADEHYGHANILKYCVRPWDSLKDMEKGLIANHNEVVKRKDIVVHVGDFCMRNRKYAENIIKQLKGTHIFVKGSHDWWLKGSSYGEKYLREITVEKQVIVCCHYAMRVWPKSHHYSWQVYGHSHGRLDPMGMQHDVGVDNNKFYPISFEKLNYFMDFKYREDLE